MTSADGFIASPSGESPQAWASAEEQALFLADVAAADWAVMGRRTHEAADRPERPRIIFSRSAGVGEWRRTSQLWLDPTDLSPEDFAAAVHERRPLRRGLILGGSAVHDWFRDRGAIDLIHLTVEPVRFGSGLPVFNDQTSEDPMEIFDVAGFFPVSERRLNANGTRYVVLKPRELAAPGQET